MLLIVDNVPISVDRAKDEREGVGLTARLLAVVVGQDPEVVAGILPKVLPWVRFLTPGELRQFATEFVATAETVASLGTTAPITLLVTMWQHTAEIHADPELDRILSAEIVDDFGKVSRP
jgi:hypothetical protein